MKTPFDRSLIIIVVVVVLALFFGTNYAFKDVREEGKLYQEILTVGQNTPKSPEQLVAGDKAVLITKLWRYQKVGFVYQRIEPIGLMTIAKITEDIVTAKYTAPHKDDFSMDDVMLTREQFVQIAKGSHQLLRDLDEKKYREFITSLSRLKEYVWTNKFFQSRTMTSAAREEVKDALP